jgi:hypothetical protein
MAWIGFVSWYPSIWSGVWKARSAPPTRALRADPPRTPSWRARFSPSSIRRQPTLQGRDRHPTRGRLEVLRGSAARGRLGAGSSLFKGREDCERRTRLQPAGDCSEPNRRQGIVAAFAARQTMRSSATGSRPPPSAWSSESSRLAKSAFRLVSWGQPLLGAERAASPDG